MSTKTPRHIELEKSTPDTGPDTSSRRNFMRMGGLCLGAGLLGATLPKAFAASTTDHDQSAIAAAVASTFVVPHEAASHVRTYMCWPSSTSIWGSTLLAKVQTDIALIARTIAKYEPVIMLADGSTNASKARSKCGTTVTVISNIPVNDLWARDSGCVFRKDASGAVDAIGLNFDGWGNKQNHSKDSLVAGLMAANAGKPFSKIAGLIAEGGAIETDGDGTVMATKSSLLGRNPTLTQAQIESKILAAYGATKMIWFNGVVGQDITDDHVDATSRFIRPGVVMVNLQPTTDTSVWAKDARAQRDLLLASTDAKGRALQVIQVDAPIVALCRPALNTPDFLNSYMNFYTPNGAVVTAQFGDTVRDNAAKAALQTAFPGRTIEMLQLDSLYGLGGGGIHCATQNQNA